MTTQITVRLPDENVAWLDAEVAAGRFPSRTVGLAKLLTKAQRRQEDEADMLKILANPDPDEESQLEWMRTRDYPPMDDDDDEAAPSGQPVTPSDVREWATENRIPTSARGRVPTSAIGQPEGPSTAEAAVREWSDTARRESARIAPGTTTEPPETNKTTINK